MTIASPKMTLAEYLAYDDGTENRYELVNGRVVAMPPESELNRRIAMFLLACFLQQGISPYRLTLKTEVTVSKVQMKVRPVG